MKQRAFKDLEVYILENETKPEVKNKAAVLFCGKGKIILNGQDYLSGTGYFTDRDDFTLQIEEDSLAFLFLFDISSHADFESYLKERFISYVPEKRRFFPIMENILLQEKDDEKFYNMCMLELRVNLIESRNEFMNKKYNKFSIEQILEYINLHIREKLSVTSLAETFYYHPTYFSNKFKQETNKNLPDYIREKKCEGVMQLHQQGVTLQQASEEYGFENYPTFYRCYKSIYGKTPTLQEEEV